MSALAHKSRTPLKEGSSSRLNEPAIGPRWIFNRFKGAEIVKLAKQFRNKQYNNMLSWTKFVGQIGGTTSNEL